MLLGGQPFVANHVKDRCLIMVDRPQQDVMHWTLYISMEPGVWVSRYVHVIYDHICYTYSYILSCIRQNCTQVCFNMLQLYQTGSRSGLGGFVRGVNEGLVRVTAGLGEKLGEKWETNADIWHLIMRFRFDNIWYIFCMNDETGIGCAVQHRISTPFFLYPRAEAVKGLVL